LGKENYHVFSLSTPLEIGFLKGGYLKPCVLVLGNTLEGFRE
jgi:hypothetical protein